MLYHSKNNPSSNSVDRKRNGFTLTELLISISIIVVILSVVVSNQSTYTDSASLYNLADQISLTISQAQAYGVGVRELSTGSSDFNIAYGLTFSLLDSGSNTAYLYFADRDANSSYNGDWSCVVGGASECLQKFDISQGNSIDSLCLIKTNGTHECNDLARVDITFARPSTEAKMFFFNNGGNPFFPSEVRGVKIILRSSKGSLRSVAVYYTGQISVE